MTKQEQALVEQVIEDVRSQMLMVQGFYFIQKDMEHKDPRDKIYYTGGQKAAEWLLDQLKELAELYGVHYGPKPEPKLKLVVNNK